MSNTPEQDAYLALLRLPHSGPRSTQAVQAAMATLRDHIADVSGKDPELVQGLAEQVTAHSAALSALSARDEGLEALRELLDEHDKAHGETKYTPAKQPPYSMTMDFLHRQTFAAMYAYVRKLLAQEPRA